VVVSVCVDVVGTTLVVFVVSVVVLDKVVVSVEVSQHVVRVETLVVRTTDVEVVLTVLVVVSVSVVVSVLVTSFWEVFVETVVEGMTLVVVLTVVSVVVKVTVVMMQQAPEVEVEVMVMVVVSVLQQEVIVWVTVVVFFVAFAETVEAGFWEFAEAEMEITLMIRMTQRRVRGKICPLL
jgi:hypothetical protein